MTVDIATALYLYTLQDPNIYQPFNAALRSSDRKVVKAHYFPYLRLFATGLNLLKRHQRLERNMKLYRGVNLDLLTSFPDVYRLGMCGYSVNGIQYRSSDLWLMMAVPIPVGGVVTFWEAASCSLSAGVVEDFLQKEREDGGAATRECTLLRLETAQAVDIHEFSAFEREAEWVLPPGTSIKVTEKCELMKGIVMLECDDPAAEDKVDAIR